MSGLFVSVPVDADTTVEVGGDSELAEISIKDAATGSEVTFCGTVDELAVLARSVAKGVSRLLQPFPEPRGGGSELDAWERSRAATRRITGERAA